MHIDTHKILTLNLSIFLNCFKANVWMLRRRKKLLFFRHRYNKNLLQNHFKLDEQNPKELKTHTDQSNFKKIAAIVADF